MATKWTSTRVAIAACIMFFCLSNTARSQLPVDEPTALNAKVMELIRAGKTSEAIPLAMRAFAILEKKLPAGHRDVAQSAKNLADLFHKQGRLEDALNWYRKAAKMGHASAMNDVGGAYTNGQGVAKDLAAAFKWYRQAADKGDTDAMNNVGIAFGNGQGVAKDLYEAGKWYRKAANAGNSSMLRLGVAYDNGQGVAKDLAEAVRWYRKAANAGDTYAMTHLGFAYDNGQGVARNDERAAEWAFRAVKAGEPNTRKNMVESAGSFRSAFRLAFQRRLKSAGFYSGKIDGKFGPGTRRAIEALAQAAN